MSTREFVALGTSSMAPTRTRNQNGYALRWDDLLLLLDPGEGYQRQALLAGVKIARADALLITHFHGDHCLGLPGVEYRRRQDNPDASLPVYFPAENAQSLGHLLSGTAPAEPSALELRPVEGSGPIGSVGGGERVGHLLITAARLAHPVPTFGYRFDEPDTTRLDPTKLQAHGVTGDAVGTLLRMGRVATEDGVVEIERFLLPRPGQSAAFLLDTSPCDGAIELAEGVDLLVCEATYLHADRHTARLGGHMTAREAGRLARDCGVRRLVLTHFSARYHHVEAFGEEAARFHSDVVVATDLSTIAVPARRPRW